MKMRTLPIPIHKMCELQKDYSKKLKEFNEKKKDYEKEYLEIKTSFDKTKDKIIDNNFANFAINDLKDSIYMLNISFSEIWNMKEELDELLNEIKTITAELAN